MRSTDKSGSALQGRRSPWPRIGFALALVAGGFLASGCNSDDDNGATLAARTLSSSPDMITGGDTLVEVIYTDPVNPGNVKLMLNGVDVSAQLTDIDPAARRLRGLVSGLSTAPGGSTNTLVVSDGGPSSASPVSMSLVSYPITGPVLSGPHIAPYECRTVENGLGVALDADCSATTQVVYYYRASNSTFKPLADPTGPRPADLVSTTTNAGVTVPYIVRVESGTVNRGVYRLAMLDDPIAGAAWKPSAGWNGKLVVSFDCCGSAQYNQGVHAIGTVLSHRELSRGFALMNSTELWNNQHANPHLQGETLMMLKEHFIKHIGMPKWTAGVGGSGGAIQQYLIAQLFPGLLDGIQPNVSFPETLMPEVWQCRLLNNVYKADLARWTTTKQNAVNGFNTNTCVSWDLYFASIIQSDNAAGCGVTDPVNVANIYNKTTNPTGLRCDFFQTNKNLLGTDASTGFALRPTDNVGVQYGLAALNRGDITATEFLDLNASVGGYDGDGIAQAARTQANLDALLRTYEGGFKNSFTGSGLANIPIITQRNNADSVADIHDTMQDLIVRARLQRANGRSDNQIIWTAGSRSAFDYGTASLETLNDWLDAIAADAAPASTDKVVRLKPSGAVDACWDASGNRINEPASTDPAAACNQVYPRFSTPLMQAGGPMTNDVMKCQLKPVTPADYTAAFSADELVRLNTIFASGVCDWSKPGVNQNPLKGTYLKLPLS